MKTEWKATSKESEKGSVIFESCDIEDYNKASEEYNKLSKSQKAQYKGQQQYITTNYPLFTSAKTFGESEIGFRIRNFVVNAK